MASNAPAPAASRTGRRLLDRLRPALLALMAAALLQEALAQPLRLRDDVGTEHVFAAPPQRILTMLPSLTESAWVLGAGPRLVGVDRFSNWPPEIAGLPRLGGLEDAQIEAIAMLRPDVVLASVSARTLDKLEALGLRVLRFRSETHADARRTLELIATLLGTPERAAVEWARIQRELDDAAVRVPPSLRGRSVYFEIGGGPYAAGTGSFIGETLARLGLANIVPAKLGPFPKLNPEFVVRARPYLIMGLQGEQAMLPNRPGWGSLAAVRERRLCSFATAQYDILTRPGPRMGEGAGLIADCLQRLERQ
jgi:iron complex transport system substrate-binding protein